MARLRHRPSHLVGAQLDRQPIDQPRHLERRWRPADQPVLRRIERLEPARLQRKRIEPEAGIERVGLVLQQPQQVRRLARRDRARRIRHLDLAVDPISGQHQPPNPEPPRLQLPGEIRHQQCQRLGRGARVGNRLGQPEQGARRRVDRGRAERLGGSPQHPVERVQRIIRLAKPSRQAPTWHADQGANGLQTQPLQCPDHPRRQPQCRDGQRRDCVEPVAAALRRKPCQPPGRARRPRHRHPRGQPERSEPRLDIAQQPRLAAEQVRHPAGIEPDPVGTIDLDQRRPARRPARHPVEQRAVARTIGGHRD